MSGVPTGIVNVFAMKNPIFTVTLSFLLAAALGAETAPVRVGLLSSVSDNWAAVGQMTVKGAEMARDEVNNRGGIKGRPLILELQDTREATSGSAAVTAYHALRARGIGMFVGLIGVPAARAIAPLVASDKAVLLITPSAGLEDFHRSSERAFNSRGTDNESSRKLALYALGKNWRSAAVVSSEQPWETAVGESFASSFTSNGGEVRQHVTAMADESDFLSAAAQINRADPDFVFLSNYNTVAAAARALRQMGYKKQILSINLDPSRLLGAGGSLNGAQFVSLALPNEEFRERFKSRYGAEPLQTADWAYDAVLLLAAALEKTDDWEAASVAAALSEVSVSGANGAPVTFGPGRCIRRGVELWQVAGERFAKLQDL